MVSAIFLVLAWFGLILVLVQILNVLIKTVPMRPQTPQTDLTHPRYPGGLTSDRQTDRHTLVLYRYRYICVGEVLHTRIIEMGKIEMAIIEGGDSYPYLGKCHAGGGV